MRWLLVLVAATALCVGAARMATAGESTETSDRINACIGQVESEEASRTNDKQGKWLRNIRLGVLAHDVGGLWSGFRRESGTDFNAEIVLARPCVEILSGALLPNVGITVNDSGDTSKLYGGIIWEYRFQSGVFFNAGLGAAAHNGEQRTRKRDKKQLGSRVLFRIPIEIGYELTDHSHVSIMFAHVSNAFLADPNEGLDTLGFRIGYKF